MLSATGRCATTEANLPSESFSNKFVFERVCCLLVLNSVTSTQQCKVWTDDDDPLFVLAEQKIEGLQSLEPESRVRYFTITVTLTTECQWTLE